MISYRFAHLLVPLQDIWHRMIVRELNVAVEDDTLAQYGCDVHSIFCKETKREQFNISSRNRTIYNKTNHILDN